MRYVAVALVALTVGCGARAEDFWFFADFDRPMELNGERYPFEGQEDAFVEGKFGKGYFFRRPSKNALLRTSDFLSDTNTFEAVEGAAPKVDLKAETVSFAGGTFLIRPRGTGIPSHWVNKWGAAVYAMEVKGRKGDTLTLTPEVEPLTEEKIKAFVKKDAKFDAGKLLPTVAEPRTVELTGEWQRVWCSARLDLRIRTLKVGCRVRSEGPVTLRKFQLQPTGTFPYHGYDQPTEWIEGGMSRPASFLEIVRQPEALAAFPVSNGTFSCWIRTPDDWIPPKQGYTIFSRGTAWNRTWTFSSEYLSLGRPNRISNWMLPRTNAWHHLAVTWKPEELAFFLDGRAVLTKPDPELADYGSEGYFRLGCGENACASDLVFDEVAVYRRALSAEEIAALVSAREGAHAKDRRCLVSPPVFTSFPRNDEATALRFTVNAPAKASGTFALTVGDLAFDPVRVSLEAGDNDVSVPFRAADLLPGDHPWKMTLATDVLAPVRLEGTLTVLPRFERDGLRLQTWNLDTKLLGFCRTVGLNAGVCPTDRLSDAVKVCAAGMHLVLRLENVKDWRECNLDQEAIAARATKRLKPYFGLPQWDSTLVNSETYSAQSADQAVTYKAWRDWAKKELGHDPVVAFSYSPAGVDWKKLGLTAPYGVMTQQNDCYDTLAWYLNHGMPNHLVNRVDHEVIHRHSPGNQVWSEPSPAPDGLDMVADWIYNYSTERCLHLMRHHEATSRPAKRRYLPTLAMGYWSPDYPEIQIDHPTQKDAKSGKPVKVMMGQTCDELKIKSWMCMGGSAADGISYFSAEWSWQQALTNGVLHAKGLPLVYSPGWQKYCLAEPDAPARYGEFVHTAFEPAALLLRGIPTVRAPMAVLLPKEIDYTGRYWWPRVNFPRALGKHLASRPIPYDVLSDGEFTAEILSKYRYVIYPQFCCITPEHDAALRSVPETTRFLADSAYNPGKNGSFDYANVEKVKGFNCNYPWTEEKVDRPLDDYLLPKIGELRGNLVAWSEQDGTNAWTFVKERKGAHYVTVVNNARRDGGCPQTDLYTNSWYRPMAAPQRIVTHFNRKGHLYEFNASKGLKNTSKAELALDYAPAEARVFCLYPEPLAAPQVALAARSADGMSLTLVVRTTLASGRPAPGRQVLRLTLTDDAGRSRDESGLYVVEDGETRIPVRFARADGKGAKWKVSVEDLTTGETVSTSFAR